MENMQNFIKQFPNSLPESLCDEIINKFENDDTKRDGVTHGGKNKLVKDTTDKNIEFGEENWKEIDEILYKEMSKRLNEYLRELNNVENYKAENNNNFDFEVIRVNLLTDTGFMIQKYTKNVGKYIYHNDGSIEWESQRSRVITYLWYLNTIDEGGQTEFWGNYRVKPEKGKLILFPASWCFPHRGIMPISDDKYIITGWFSLNEGKLDSNNLLLPKFIDIPLKTKDEIEDDEKSKMIL